MNIMALDMATKTGWAHSCGASGVWDLSILKDESSGMRLIRFEAKLIEVIGSIGVEVIVFESINAGGSVKSNFESTKLMVKLQAIVERVAETNACEHMGVHLATLKKHALPGVKKRDKAAMVAAAVERWPGTDIIDDNHADALWLLDYYLVNWSPAK